VAVLSARRAAIARPAKSCDEGAVRPFFLPQFCLSALGFLLGCSAQPPPVLLPAGIAELTLPTDSASLQRASAADEAAGSTAQRSDLLAGMNRQVLMAPPDNVFVPELFDFVVVMAPRMEAGAISPAWASYLYTNYQRDLRAERPGGTPRRSTSEIRGVLDAWVEHYQIRAKPGAAAQSAVRDAEFDALREYRDNRRLGR
jgi:hypothetical protein